MENYDVYQKVLNLWWHYFHEDNPSKEAYWSKHVRKLDIYNTNRKDYQRSLV